MNSIRSFLYFLARLMGDINAVRRGPEAIAKRVARKAIGRAYGSAVARLIK